jgi:hypothetical protein
VSPTAPFWTLVSERRQIRAMESSTSYFFSQIATLLNIWSRALLPVVVTVWVLPSRDMTTRVVVVGLPLTFVMNSKEWSLISLNALVVFGAAPFSGYSLPSNLALISGCVG